jgi:hypothetical protein
MKGTIVLLPAFGAPKTGDIARTTDGKYYRLSKYFTTFAMGELARMEMYVISNDNIVKDDYYIQGDSVIKKVDNQSEGNGRKVIFTTDTKLTNDNVQPLSDDIIRTALNDLNSSGLADVFYETKLVNPLGRTVNPMDTSVNTSGCKWVYTVSYGKPVSTEEDLNNPLSKLLAEFDKTNKKDAPVPATPEYTKEQAKVLFYRYIKEVLGKPIFDSDEAWFNENL